MNVKESERTLINVNYFLPEFDVDQLNDQNLEMLFQY